jgi:hypothetical protein
MTNKPSGEYEVLSPWAEADTIPLKGISPRVDTLEGKTIGLFRNSKRAAQPIMTVVEKRLKEKFPAVRITEFADTRPNEVIIDQAGKGEFEEWLGGVDAVIAAFGD